MPPQLFTSLTKNLGIIYMGFMEGVLVTIALGVGIVVTGYITFFGIALYAMAVGG